MQIGSDPAQVRVWRSSVPHSGKGGRKGTVAKGEGAGVPGDTRRGEDGGAACPAVAAGIRGKAEESGRETEPGGQVNGVSPLFCSTFLFPMGRRSMDGR